MVRRKSRKPLRKSRKPLRKPLRKSRKPSRKPLRKSRKPLRKPRKPSRKSRKPSRKFRKSRKRKYNFPKEFLCYYDNKDDCNSEDCVWKNGKCHIRGNVLLDDMPVTVLYEILNPKELALYMMTSKRMYNYHKKIEVKRDMKKEYDELNKQFADSISTIMEPTLSPDGRRRNNSRILELLNKGANVNLRNNRGDTALMITIIEDRLNLVKELLKRKDIDVNLQNHDPIFGGNTALMFAVIYARAPRVDDDTETGVEILKELLKRKDIDVNLRNEDGQTALLIAIREELYYPAKELLKRKDIDVNLRDEDGQTALLIALREELWDEAKELLKRKDIDVNAQIPLETGGIGGWTALMLASSPSPGPLQRRLRSHSKELVKELLKRKDIDVNLRNEDGDTALKLASNSGFTEVVKELEKAGAKF